MDDTIDLKRQQVMKMLNQEVSKYTNQGSTLPQAISLVCKNLGLNPYDITDKYFPEVKSDVKTSYKDIKANEGSFVTLKGDSGQNQYEVININSKDAIVLRNTDNNEEIIASEDEITPVITENKMDKLNEAQYSVSINGLETTDANALSQMLSSAAQAEQNNGSALGSEPLAPEPMDMTDGLPMDMDNPLPSMDMPMDSTLPDESLPMNDEPEIVDDVEFDEELPDGEEISLDTDANAYANPEMDTAVVPTDSLKDAGFEEPSEEDSMENELEDAPVDSTEEIQGEAEDIINEPSEEGMSEEPIEDMSMDDMMDDGMFEAFDYDALIKEAMEAAQLDEAEEIIPASEDIEDAGEGAQENYAEEITEGKKCCSKCDKEDCKCKCECDKEDLDESNTSFDDEIAEALRLAGVQLDEAEEMIPSSNNVDQSIIDKIANDLRIYNQGRDEIDDGQEPDAEKIINSIEYIINTYGLSGRQALKAYSEATFMDYDTVKDAWESDGSAWDGEIPEDEEQIEEGTINDEINAGYSDDFDNEIAEALRLAGVQLDEAESTLPTTVDQKTLYANKEAEKNEDLAPEYHEVDTTPFSKDASEGFKLTLEAAVKTDKVKQIYETAKSMYAKKDVKDWLSLDRRYITKLIKEGCGYERANKLLTAAKQGK